VGDGHAGGNDSRDVGVDVEPGFFEQRSFTAAYGHVRNRRIAGIVISIFGEEQTGNSFGAQAHAGCAQTGGSCAKRRVTQNHGKTIGRKSAGIAEGDSKAELNVAGGNERRPNNLAMLIIFCGGQLYRASRKRYRVAERRPLGIAEIRYASEWTDEKSGGIAGDGGSGAVADDGVEDGAVVGERGGIPGVCGTGGAGNRGECGTARRSFVPLIGQG